MDALIAAKKALVNLEALVGNAGVVHKEEDTSEDTSSCCTINRRVLGLPTYERSGMDTELAIEVHGFKRCLKILNFAGDISRLIVEDHTYDIVSGRQPIWVETPRFVNEYADVLRDSHANIQVETTKARIAPRPRQESFPRAGDFGFRRCRRVIYHKSRRCDKGGAKMGGYFDELEKRHR